MNLIDSKGFLGLEVGELEAYAQEKAFSLGLTVPPPYLPGVLENLIALQSHAAGLAAALKDLEQGSCGTLSS